MTSIFPRLPRRLSKMHVTTRSIAAILAVIWVMVAIGFMVLKSETACPGGTLSMCQLEFVGQEEAGYCGELNIQSGSQCSVFVKTEECFCKKCKTCLKSSQHSHCALSRDVRLAKCLNQFSRQKSQ